MAHRVSKYIKRLYSTLGDFWNAEKYTDVTIECENEKFECHRLVLAASCKFFDAMFGGQFRERTAENISLPGMSARTFKQVLQYIYTGDTSIDSRNVLPLLHASEFFALTGIEDLCVRFVKLNEVTVRDSVEIFIFASATKKKSLVELFCSRIAKHFEIFSKIDSFLEIPFDSFKTIVTCYIQSSRKVEEVLLSAISRWIHHDREQRSQYFNQLVKMIRFEDISFPYIQFMFTNFCLGAPDPLLTRAAMGYIEDTVLQEDTTSLHVFVEHPEEKFMKVYSVDSALECSSIFDWNREYEPSKSWLRNITLNNSYLYSLHYCFFPNVREDPTLKQTFSACTSISNPSDLRLKSPPVNFSADINLCAVKNNIYAYYPGDSVIASQSNPSNLFNEEELKRGVCVYNCEVDDWFPVPKMEKRATGACLTSQDDLLYLIGGYSLDDSTVPRYAGAQMYDVRLGKWQKVAESHHRYVEAACCSMNGKIYVVGGLSKTRIERYDPGAGRWEKMTDSPLDKEITSFRLVPHLGRLYIMGGFLKDTTYSRSYDLSVHKFDVESRSWYCSSVLTDSNTFKSGSIVDAVVFKS